MALRIKHNVKKFNCYNKLRKACNKGVVPEHEVKRIIANQEWYTKKHEQEKIKQLQQAQVNIPLSQSSTMPDTESKITDKIKVGKPLNFRP